MKSTIIILSGLLLSNSVWAYDHGKLTSTNSLSNAAVEIMAMDNPPPKNIKPATPVNHESQNNNSLFDAVLAKQEKQNQNAQVDTTPSHREPDPHRNTNSLFSSILEKQAERNK